MKVEVADQIPSFDKPAGTVLEQDPAAEAKSRRRCAPTHRDQSSPRRSRSRRSSLYDPPPGDGTENTGKLPNLIDGKESTSWTTELYRSSEFGNLKTGVGLDFTLEERRVLSSRSCPAGGRLEG